MTALALMVTKSEEEALDTVLALVKRFLMEKQAPPPVAPAPAVPRGASLTVPEVMERLKVSRSWCYRAIKDGRLRAIRLGRNVRIPESALAKLERAQEMAA